MLLENAGYTIVGVADNGIDGLDLCRRCNPDLALYEHKVSPRHGVPASTSVQV